MTLHNIKKGEWVAIKWLDASSADEWVTQRSVSDHGGWVIGALTVGLVLFADKREVILAQTISEKGHDSAANVFAIPRGMIQSVHNLTISKGPRRK